MRDKWRHTGEMDAGATLVPLDPHVAHHFDAGPPEYFAARSPG